ncbi:MAG: type II RES/Xre toxin-antitoxin system antitoxin [bacterium]
MKQLTATQIKEVSMHYQVTSFEWGAPLKESLGIASSSRAMLINLIREGIRVDAFERLSKTIGVTAKELAAVTDITTRTLARRKKEGRLHADESDRLVRVALLFEQAVALFEGDREKASQWFRSPKKAFDGASPLAFSDTEIGAQEVSELIGRLEHGVFS